jgi:hypothetical protein
MADASKLKGLGRLGAPPPLEEARADLVPPPEAVPEPTPPPPVPPPEAPSVMQSRPQVVEIEDYERVDGRTLRKTGRTIPFSTRLNVDTDRLIRRLAGKHGILIAEVVERGAKLLEQELSKKDG